MNYYTSTIPPTLAEKLKEKGMPYIEIDCETYDSGTEYQRDERWCNNTYAEVFDWLMEKDIRVYPVKIKDCSLWHIILNDTLFKTLYNTWHEAAENAIEKALTLI